MPISGGGYAGPKEIEYLFIDGGCTRATLQDISDRYPHQGTLRLDYYKLTHRYNKVFYYDALPAKKQDETLSQCEERIEPQRRFLDDLSAVDRFHVYEGDMRRSRTRRSNEQKKIDVMIAVDMLTHSFRRNMHRATLLTSDLDFKPLLDALVHEGMFVTLWYPPKDTNRELVAAADTRMPFTIQNIGHALADDAGEIKLPEVTMSHSRVGAIFPELQTWAQDEDRAPQLFERGGQHFFAFPYGPPGNSGYAAHRDLSFLREYIKDAFGLEVPAAHT